VLICIIDSGIDKSHPEFANGPDNIDGCKEEDTVANAGCPYQVGLGVPASGLGCVCLHKRVCTFGREAAAFVRVRTPTPTTPTTTIANYTVVE